MRIPRLTIVLVFLAVVACGPDVYEMKQTIEMGPFVFEVTNASEKLDSFTSGERYKKIYVNLLLHTDKSTPTKVPFNDFLNGIGKEYRMIVFPKMKIVDDKGKEFDGWVERVLGKTSWRAKFDLYYPQRRIQSGLDYVDRHVRDFRLVIKNPDPKKGQPNRVTIKLQ